MKERKTTSSNIQVMLDIFSGRRNPVWDLLDEDIGELAKRFHGTSEHETVEIPRIPDLGYGGIVVQNYSKDQRLPYEIRAYNSVLIIIKESRGQKRFYKDINKIEELLLNQAREHGYGDLIDKIA